MHKFTRGYTMYKLYYRLCHEQVITGTRVHLDVCWSVSSDVYQVRNNSGVLNWKAKLTVVEVCDSLRGLNTKYNLARTVVLGLLRS